MSSTSQHFVESNLVLTYYQFCQKNFFFLCFSFLLLWFICCVRLASTLKVSHSLFRNLWESLANSSFSIWKTSKNSSQWSQIFCAVISFNSLNWKPFLLVIKESSLLILSLGQMKPTTYFFLDFFSMKTTIISLWTQTFNVWMGIFLTKSSLLFLKWNSIKDSCAGIGLAPQANMLFERVQIPSFSLG